MTKGKICIVGHFGQDKLLLNGQTIKTEVLTGFLEEKFGPDQILRIDTSGGWNALYRIPYHLFGKIRKCDNFIILPAYKGLRYIMFLIAVIHPFTMTKFHYAVIGGWLPSFIEKRYFLSRWLHLLDGIYVETVTMKKALECNYKNIYLMPNSKKLNPVSFTNIPPLQYPIKLCTFSRVMKGKGLAEAAEVICRINNKQGQTVFKLDIYGPIWPSDQEWFTSFIASCPDYIQYKGFVESDKSVSVLKDYFMLLFPTRFYTEGVPGTIIDAYAAGLPVLASRWESFSDVIEDGKTGLGFAFDDFNMMERVLEKIQSNPHVVLAMKKDCLRKASEFSPEKVFSTLIDHLS
ncbi:MAG: glycosyltransferase [Bacteroidaceae bacterium]|nr:glycosyltransferase [Bacteroidaceae bacterium]